MSEFAARLNAQGVSVHGSWVKRNTSLSAVEMRSYGGVLA